MRVLHRALVAALLVTASLGVAHVAYADDSALADVLFEDGRKLVESGKYEEACPKFEASLAAAPALGTLLNLADCLDKSGKKAASWQRWTEALSMARSTNDERASFAEKRVAELEPEVRRVRLQIVEGTEPLVVALGGSTVEPSRFGLPIAVEAESAELTVLRGDEVLERRSVALAKGKVESIELDLGAIAAAHPAPVAEVATEDMSDLRLAGWINLGTGLAGVAAFAVLEGIALGQRSEADAPGGCVDRDGRVVCTPQGYELVERSGDFAEAGQWAGIAGGTIAAAGLVMVLVANAREQSGASPSSAFVVPWLAPGSGGLVFGASL